MDIVSLAWAALMVVPFTRSVGEEVDFRSTNN